MKQKLPQSQVTSIDYFPKNLRFITEYTLSEAQSNNIKIVLVSVFSIFLLVLIVLQGLILWHNLMLQKTYEQQRVRLQNEINYWQGIATKYQGDRDVLYRIAALQYKMGNVAEAQTYVKKALELDPNFPEGRVLGAKVGL